MGWIMKGHCGGEIEWRVGADGMIEIHDGHETILFGVDRADEVVACIAAALRTYGRKAEREVE
jgi:hypothetical protein